MKAGTVLKVVLAILGIAGITYVAKPELLRNYLPESLTERLDEITSENNKKSKKGKKKTPNISNIGIVKGAEWVDCAKVRDKVATEINQKLSTATESVVAEFLRTPGNQLLLAQWVIADAEVRGLEEEAKNAENRNKELEKLSKNLAEKKALVPAGTEAPAAIAWDIKQLEKKIAKLEGEIKSAHLFSESAAGKGGSKLMELVGGDPEWAYQFAFSGECVRPGMALSILKKISKHHPDMVNNRMVRDIATATALEYAKSNWNQADAVERANFYIESWKEGRLNTVFDTLPMWQRRMVCGCKGDNPYGSLVSMRWSQDNMRLPADRYSSACWRCSYRLHNIYGDSIHGPLYYTPFESELGENRAAMTYHVGGVCGSLSHFGAFAALANGVPAMTSGEPAHCSYIVLVGDKWTPAYSLSWQRGLHWQVFRNVYSYSSLHSATELYADSQKEKTDISNALRVLAGVKATAGDLLPATEAYALATKTQPRNWMAWREWMEALKADSSATAENWEQLNTALCTNLVPLFPEMGFELMQKGMVDELAKALGDSPDRLRNAYLKYWKSIKEMGPDRWRIETLGDKQLAAMGIDAKKPAELCAYYSDVLSGLITNEKYGPAILNWGNTLSAKLDKKDQPLLTKAMISSISKSSDMSKEERIKLLSPIVLAAEKSRDRVSFRSIANIIADMGHTNPDIKMPQFEAFPGKLASENGMVWMSSTSKWDKPHEHASLLTPQGGTFHTGKDKDAYVVVELPRQVNVTGVVLVTAPGNLHRHNNMKIQVSENGEDWTDVHSFGPCKQRVMRSDLGGKLPVAKYVRILREGGPEFFHLNGIYIYGNQAA